MPPSVFYLITFILGAVLYPLSEAAACSPTGWIVTSLTPLVGEEARAHAESRAVQETEAENRWELTEKIMAGDMTLEDLPDDMTAYTSFTIEDYVTPVGQGPLKGCREEMLAQLQVQPAE